MGLPEGRPSSGTLRAIAVVELHRDPPDRPLIAVSDPFGVVTTGVLVKDGMRFCLVDPGARSELALLTASLRVRHTRAAASPKGLGNALWQGNNYLVKGAHQRQMLHPSAGSEPMARGTRQPLSEAFMASSVGTSSC